LTKVGIMNTLEIIGAFHQVPTTNLLCFPFPRLVKYTVIINTDIDTEAGIHWVAVHLEKTSSIGCYLYSWALFPLVSAIPDYLEWVNSVELQHTHVALFYHQRLPTVLMPLCAQHGPGTGNSPICRHVWDDGVWPTGWSFHEGVRAAEKASQRWHSRRAVLHLRKR
jgi:hypothetical protein